MTLTGILTIIALPVWVAMLAAMWRGRRWLPFYVTGALGWVVLVVVIATLTGWDQALSALEARQVGAISHLLGPTLVVLGQNGLAIKNHTGWGVFDIGIECSGLLEMAAMSGLILFYPAVFTPLRKAFIVTVGTLASYVFNLVRIMLIVQMVAHLGTDWVFPAHAIFGRMLFFVLTIGLYWWLVTMPTVRHVGRVLETAHE